MDRSARFVDKCSINIDHEVVRQNEEASLVHHVSVSLDDKGMVLIAIVLCQVTIALEKLLPVDR